VRVESLEKMQVGCPKKLNYLRVFEPATLIRDLQVDLHSHLET